MRKIFFAFLALLLLVSPLAAQTITQPLANQTVAVGATAIFTITVSGGPCRSLWTINGAGHYGSVASTISYTLPPATLAMNGWKIQAELYGCTGGGTTLNSSAVLSVIPVITLASLAITTPAPIIGIGQIDSLTVMGTYSDGSTQNLTSTAAWASLNPAVASASAGTVLGLAIGGATITATIGTLSASTMVTVEPGLVITFTPSNEDASVPAASLVVNQIVLNADGSSTATPALVLPDPSGATSGTLLYNSALLYDAVFYLNQIPVGNPLIFSPTLMTLVMPNIKSMSFAATLCVTSCVAGAVKSMSWSSQ